MNRSIAIILSQIEKRESRLTNPEYFLRFNELKAEIASLNKALKLIKNERD